MSLFNIYQNHALRNNSVNINAIGWDEAGKQFPAVKAHMEMSMGAVGNKWDKGFFEHYNNVATVRVADDSLDIMDSLESVFAASNGHPNSKDDNYVNTGRAHSLSVGDIVHVANKNTTNDDTYYLCMAIGFVQIEVV